MRAALIPWCSEIIARGIRAPGGTIRGRAVVDARGPVRPARRAQYHTMPRVPAVAGRALTEIIRGDSVPPPERPPTV
jgi:hypothetical protein